MESECIEQPLTALTSLDDDDDDPRSHQRVHHDPHTTKQRTDAKDANMEMSERQLMRAAAAAIHAIDRNSHYVLLQRLLWRGRFCWCAGDRCAVCNARR